MKITILFIFFLFFSISAYAQKDSVAIKFNYLEKDLSLICELSDIQYISMTCSDTNMRGKKFLLSFDEYLDGKKIDEDTSYLICKDEKIPFIMGKDTVYEILNMCDRMSFSQDDSIFKIRFAGKLDKDTFKLMIAYSGIRMTKLYAGNEKFSLRPINCSSSEEVKIKLNTLTPFLAYTTPFETASGAASYCILGSEKIEDWYTKFKVKHFYIINLKIE